MNAARYFIRREDDEPPPFPRHPPISSRKLLA